MQVGFDGNGNGGVRVDAAVLQRHLDVLRRDHHWVHTIERPGDAGVAMDNHTLPLRVDYIIRASHSSTFASRGAARYRGPAPPSRTRPRSQLAVAVNRLVAARDGAFLDPAPLEQLLREHTDTVHSGSTLTLFLLNPHLPLPAASDDQAHQAYWYRPVCGAFANPASSSAFIPPPPRPSATHRRTRAARSSA